MGGGGEDHRRDAADPLCVGSTGKLLGGKRCASSLVVLGPAVINRIMEPDRRFDGVGVVQQRAIVAGKRQHRLDMGKAVIVTIPGFVEPGKR